MQKMLGIDFGEARIGLALSDDLGFMAHPLTTIRNGAAINPLPEIILIVEREKVSTIVIGMPRNMNGTYGPAAEKVRAFAELLRARTNSPLVFWDERMTSVQAQRSLHDSGRNTKQSRAVIDQVAAQLILQSYLDSQATPG